MLGSESTTLEESSTTGGALFLRRELAVCLMPFDEERYEIGCSFDSEEEEVPLFLLFCAFFSPV